MGLGGYIVMEGRSTASGSGLLCFHTLPQSGTTLPIQALSLGDGTLGSIHKTANH